MTIDIYKILKDMEENEVVFKTAGGRRPLKIRNVDLENQTFRFERSTGKISWPLSIKKFETVLSDVIENKIDLDYILIDKRLPRFGNYSVGLIEHMMRVYKLEKFMCDGHLNGGNFY